jgi:hypothetical protein
MYRMLAIFWLVVGVVWILYDYSSGGNGAFSIPGLGWSAGWVCVLLAVYNFMRWWSRRVSSRTDAQYRTRRDYLRNPPPVRREPPDPNFNFTDEEPKPEPPPQESRE